MNEKTNQLLPCYHCGNTVPQEHLISQVGKELYEHIDGQRYSEDFCYELYQCPTCKGVSVYGDFVQYPKQQSILARRIYPQGAHLVPDSHKLDPKSPVPEHIVRIYEEIWPIRHISPNTFAGQLRRMLEFICQDQGAQGDTLFLKIKNLTTRNVINGHLIEIADLMRRAGNLGAHANAEEADFWDAELLDDFFRLLVDYVYIAPAKIRRLKSRLQTKLNSKGH